MNKTKAIYSGSFDPIHNGHLDIIKRASQLFKLEVVVADNPLKKYALTFVERLNLVHKAVNHLPVVINALPAGSLLADYAQLRGVPLVVKGVRGFNDFDYERALHDITVSQQSGVQTVLLPGLPSLQHVSSTAVKELVKLHGDLQHYAPKAVIVALQQSLNQQHIVGVTGGIGCGKSTLCKYLTKFPVWSKYREVVHIDLDKVVATVYDNLHQPAIQSMFREVATKLKLTGETWTIDELKQRVSHEIFVIRNTEFQHWYSQQLRPFALAELRSRLYHYREQIRGRPEMQLVLLESALFVQEGLLYLCNNNVWQVMADKDQQLRRLTTQRNLEESAATARLTAQSTAEAMASWIKTTIDVDGYGSLKLIDSETDIPMPSDTVQISDRKRERLRVSLAL